MKKISTCWNITSRCNENCKFCYRIMCNKENTYEQNKKILDILIKLKIDKISWTGGECLLYPHLFDLMKIAHENNIKNNIITNGKILIPKIIDEIEEYTDYVTLSLDTLEDDINNDLGRGIDHGKNVIKLLDYMQHKSIKVKLNSIVTKRNINNIKEIANIVKTYKIERWKLFKFIPLRGKSIENQNEFEIEEEQYEKIIKEINKEGISCPIIKCKKEELEKKYLLINPIGEFVITDNGKDKILCDYENIDIIKLKEILDK